MQRTGLHLCASARVPIHKNVYEACAEAPTWNFAVEPLPIEEEQSLAAEPEGIPLPARSLPGSFRVDGTLFLFLVGLPPLLLRFVRRSGDPPACMV